MAHPFFHRPSVPLIGLAALYGLQKLCAGLLPCQITLRRLAFYSVTYLQRAMPLERAGATALARFQARAGLPHWLGA